MNAGQMKKDPVAFLEAEIKNYIANSPNNIMPDFPGEHMWDEPLIGFANGDAPLFTEHKKIIGDFHVTPREALEMNLKRKAIGYEHPKNISVTSHFLPRTKPLKERREPVYVVAGSKAEARTKSNPNKEVRIVPGMIRRPPN